MSTPLETSGVFFIPNLGRRFRAGERKNAQKNPGVSGGEGGI